MTHDPMCPSPKCIDSGCKYCCRCNLIAKVRAETREAEWERRREAERIMHERHSAALREAEKRAERADGHLVVATLLAWREGEAAMLAKCITAVENLPDWALNIDDVIEALRALQEKP